MTETQPRRPRGRPRKPDALTAEQRRTAAMERLRATGGVRRCYALSGEVVAALTALRARDGDASEAALIERLVLAAAGGPSD